MSVNFKSWRWTFCFLNSHKSFGKMSNVHELYVILFGLQSLINVLTSGGTMFIEINSRMDKIPEVALFVADFKQ